MMSLSARLLISRPCCSFLTTATTTTNQCRAKHSATQVKRLFKNNPARARVDARMGVDKTPLPLPKAQFPTIFKEVKILQNGWSAPEASKPEYPFDVRRTRNKPNDAVGFLPVYSKFRKDGTKATTRIRKVNGNVDLFIEELRANLQIPQPRNPRDDNIRVRVGGTIEVDGNRVRDVKEWLTGLGF